MAMDTIFALASGPGKAGVAVIRISGPQSFRALEKLGGRVPAPRFASLQALREANGDLLDEALVLAFKKGASFTGEDVVELQVHGSSSVVRRTLELLSKVEGCRLAEPGEFTRRALDKGRLDLSQVEGLADLIDAETDAQRKQAQRLLQGAMSDRVGSWRDRLIEARSLLEVTIDFADEEVPVDVSSDVTSLLSGVRQEVTNDLQGFRASSKVREGFEVAIVGPPNVGKSTLLNALAGRDAAITSEVAGTTRDVIEVRMSIEGLSVTLLDTAGLRETDDAIEAKGVALARRRAESADIRIFLTEVDGIADPSLLQPDDIVRRSKADLHGTEHAAISGLTGFGMEDLLSSLGGILKQRTAVAGVAVNQRHVDALRSGVEHLNKALELTEGGPDVYDIASEEVRLASQSFAHLIGQVALDDVYDQIFSRFCLGK